MRRLSVFLILSIFILSFSSVYNIKIGETSFGTSVLIKVDPQTYRSISTIDYGVVYTVDATTVYDGLWFKNYVASFTVDGTFTGILKAENSGNEINFVYETRYGSKTSYKLSGGKFVILDNNFILAHIERLLEYPIPYFKLVVPQLIFNPSKTEFATGQASLKKNGEIFEIKFQDESIKIKYENGKIISLEYPGFVKVELKE